MIPPFSLRWAGAGGGHDRTGGRGGFDLLQTIRNVRPTVLIGVAGVPGLFTEAAVRAMTEGVERPVVLPLSNPTSRVEALPSDIMRWSGGRALVATGSPFAPVDVGGTPRIVSQCNNSYIFPGMGLAAIVSRTRRVTDGMFLAAAEALAGCAGATGDGGGDGALLPPLARVREVSAAIAVAVIRQAVAEDYADPPAGNIEEVVSAAMWSPVYRPMRYAAIPSAGAAEPPAG